MTTEMVVLSVITGFFVTLWARSEWRKYRDEQDRKRLEQWLRMREDRISRDRYWQ